MTTHHFEEREAALRDGRKVRLRAVRADDVAGFVGFFDGLSAQSRDFMHGWSDQCTREHAEKLAARVDAPDHLAVVAVTIEQPERFVGYCWIDGMGGDDAPMLGIGIIDEFHGAGLGKILLRALVAWAGRLGAERVRLGVWMDNARALRVYRAVGFDDDPTLPAKDFDGRTELYMVVRILHGESE